MNKFAQAFITECIKLRRSPILWLTVAVFAFIPLMLGLLMFVAKNPAIAAKLGLIGTKASMLRFGKADWQSFLGFISQAAAAVGMLGFGFVTSWVFGREYTEKTIKDLLALPVSRTYIVIAKFIIVLLWCILLSAVLLAMALISGIILHLDGWSAGLALQWLFSYSFASLLTILLCTPVAFFASWGRGYLLPMAFVIFTLLMANFTGLLGIGPYFPWAIPGIFIIPQTSEGLRLFTSSYIILFLTAIIGFFATLSFWHIADQR